MESEDLILEGWAPPSDHDEELDGLSAAESNQLIAIEAFADPVVDHLACELTQRFFHLIALVALVAYSLHCKNEKLRSMEAFILTGNAHVA